MASHLAGLEKDALWSAVSQESATPLSEVVLSKLPPLLSMSVSALLMTESYGTRLSAYLLKTATALFFTVAASCWTKREFRHSWLFSSCLGAYQ
jgi:hypothetical protein